MSILTLFFILRVLGAMALLGFLALFFFYLHKDLRREPIRQEIIPPSHLLAIEGEDVQGVYDLEEMNLIGRAADNTIQLDESTVSAYHARLSFNQGQWWLEDLGSRNGTYLNDIVVEEPLVVTYGDEIQFGKARYQLNSGRHHYETRPAGTTEEAPHKNADAPFPQHLD